MHDLVIDAKSGLTGAGRGLKQNTLFSEAGEGLSPYSVGTHRHAPEIEQENEPRGGLSGDGEFHSASDSDGAGRVLHLLRQARWRNARRSAGGAGSGLRDEPFVHVAGKGVLPQIQTYAARLCSDRRGRRPHQGSRHHGFDARQSGERSAGQAIQNMNLMFGLPETAGWSKPRCFRRRRSPLRSACNLTERTRADAKNRRRGARHMAFRNS